MLCGHVHISAQVDNVLLSLFGCYFLCCFFFLLAVDFAYADCASAASVGV